jgi:hypothetical protein
MRTRAAVPASIVLGFALLAVVLPNAMPAAGQPAPPGTLQFQETEAIGLAPGQTMCQMVDPPAGHRITLESFIGEANGPMDAWLDLDEGGPAAAFAQGRIALELRAVGGRLSGHTLTLVHSHPDGPGFTDILICAKSRSRVAATFIGTVVGYAEPIPPPS